MTAIFLVAACSYDPRTLVLPEVRNPDTQWEFSSSALWQKGGEARVTIYVLQDNMGCAANRGCIYLDLTAPKQMSVPAFDPWEATLVGSAGAMKIDTITLRKAGPRALQPKERISLEGGNIAVIEFELPANFAWEKATLQLPPMTGASGTDLALPAITFRTKWRLFQTIS